MWTKDHHWPIRKVKNGHMYVVANEVTSWLTCIISYEHGHWTLNLGWKISTAASMTITSLKCDFLKDKTIITTFVLTGNKIC